MGQDQDRANSLSTWMFLQTYTKNFLRAIKNEKFLTLTGLNNQKLLKYLPPSIVTALGHLGQERKNLQSKNQVKYGLEID